jgi:hypothetical protein
MPALAAAAAISAGVGFASSAIGAAESYEGAKKQANAQNAITGYEQQENQVRQQQMNLNAQRSQMETLRNQQRARSLALNSATSQGAQFGSGLSGGYGQISGQANTQLVNTNQNTALGNQMFGLDALISQQKINMSNAGTQIALGQGISSLGKSAAGVITPLNNLWPGQS